MIRKIVIKNTPPYFNGDQTIEPKHINFIFGLNGSGKTTVSRFLRSPEKNTFSECRIDWHNTPLNCAVYNRDYVKENFSESSMPGIFTLGEENIEIKNRIAELTSSIRVQKDKSENLQKEINGDGAVVGYQEQLKQHEATYVDLFWKIKQQFDKDESPLLLALEGSRGSKEVFKKNLLDQLASNKETYDDKDKLEQACSILFVKNIESIAPIQVPAFDELISFESVDTLGKVIVGKDDVDIAGLIKKLGNHTWFEQGVTYLELSDGKCPFCQRPIDEGFTNQIAEYFDENYNSMVAELKRLYERYVQTAESLLRKLNAIALPPQFEKEDELTISILSLNKILEENKSRLFEKASSPNVVVELETVKDVAEQIERLLNEANNAIQEHNKRIENIKEEKEKLKNQVWRYILDALASPIEIYQKEKERLFSIIHQKTEEKSEADRSIVAMTSELSGLEQQLTSVVPTANGINNLLKNYGFTGFSLKVDEEEKCYQFVRSNGQPAYESLSEGERNFVTFLYFMYALHGNIKENGHNDDKVVVIDDPVSSLDSDVLFIVSSLLRDLFADIYAEKGSIKQLFILSHNNFFFKEVSYKRGLTNSKTGYWMIVKSNDISKILEYDENPVNSTYEMLWAEIKNAEVDPKKCNTLTLANTMRRIIEHYFSLLGGKDLNNLHLEFPDGERQVFKSLISWANMGSHSAFDDYSATPTLYNAEKHLKVFKDLFDKTGHISHYNMMMKIDTEKKENG
ncbi:AAA family ATPase [bacterium]|nr:AAA family ATPase [bacterium]